MLRTFPDDLVLHPEEVRKVDPISKREERWVPGEPEGGCQQWRRYTLQRDAELAERGALSVLPVRYQDCIADLRSRLQRLFARGYKGETYGELWAPIGKEGGNITVQTLMPRAREAFLAWARQAGVGLNSELVQELFPECEALEMLESEKLVCLVVTDRMRTEEGRLEETMEKRLHAMQEKQEKQKGRLEKQFPQQRFPFLVANENALFRGTPHGVDVKLHPHDPYPPEAENEPVHPREVRRHMEEDLKIHEIWGRLCQLCDRSDMIKIPITIIPAGEEELADLVGQASSIHTDRIVATTEKVQHQGQEMRKLGSISCYPPHIIYWNYEDSRCNPDSNRVLLHEIMHIITYRAPLEALLHEGIAEYGASLDAERFHLPERHLLSACSYRVLEGDALRGFLWPANGYYEGDGESLMHRLAGQFGSILYHDVLGKDLEERIRNFRVLQRLAEPVYPRETDAPERLRKFMHTRQHVPSIEEWMRQVRSSLPDVCERLRAHQLMRPHGDGSRTLWISAPSKHEGKAAWGAIYSYSVQHHNHQGFLHASEDDREPKTIQSMMSAVGTCSTRPCQIHLRSDVLDLSAESRGREDITPFAFFGRLKRQYRQNALEIARKAFSRPFSITLCLEDAGQTVCLGDNFYFDEDDLREIEKQDALERQRS